MKKYSFPDYDRHLCLRVSFGMWLTLLFLVRAYAILLLSLSNVRAPLQLIDLLYPDRAVLAVSAGAALPALAVFYAWLKRQPDADGRVRWIWRHGRALLAFSTVLNALVLLPWLWSQRQGIDWIFFGQFLICLLIIYFLYDSERVKDTFADFPTESNE